MLWSHIFVGAQMRHPYHTRHRKLDSSIHNIIQHDPARPKLLRLSVITGHSNKKSTLFFLWLLGVVVLRLPSY